MFAYIGFQLEDSYLQMHKNDVVWKSYKKREETNSNRSEKHIHKYYMAMLGKTMIQVIVDRIQREKKFKYYSLLIYSLQ